MRRSVGNRGVRPLCRRRSAKSSARIAGGWINGDRTEAIGGIHHELAVRVCVASSWNPMLITKFPFGSIAKPRARQQEYCHW